MERRAVIYRDGPLEVDLDQRELRVGGTKMSIGAQPFKILELLIQAQGDVVSKRALMDRIWPGRIVEDNALQAHISALRRALGGERERLRTTSGRGYRLLANWQRRMPAYPVHTPGAGSMLPLAGSALIGRDAAVQSLCEKLGTRRIVTLSGFGGIGKTRLALEVARTLQDRFAGNVSFVDLAALADPGLVASAAAFAAGVQLGGPAPNPLSVTRAIGEQRMLLVLDNCEHVIDAAAGLAEAIIQGCPHAFIIATSREPLRADGEFVYRVPPLDVPPLDLREPATILQHSATRLLVDRMRVLDPDFLPGRDNLAVIAAICRRLDGLPLAIEFAAARAGTLGLDQVLAGLDDRFRLLTTGYRTAPERHQTLRATLDWSYQLLNETERRLLRHMAIFAGPFTLDAVTSVMTGRHAGKFPNEVGSLVAKALVAIDTSAGETRWRLLDTVRSYALEKLAESGEQVDAARCYAGYYRDLFAPSDAVETTALTIERVEDSIRELDNVRAALEWAFSAAGDPTTGVALTAAYVPVWLYFSLTAECQERAEDALRQADWQDGISPRLQAQLLTSLGVVLVYTGAPATRISGTLAVASRVAENLDDPGAQLIVLWGRWIHHFLSGEYHVAQTLADEFAALALRAGSADDMTEGERLLGSTKLYAADLPAARRHFERVLAAEAAASEGRNQYWYHYTGTMPAKTRLARVLWLQGEARQASQLAREAFDLARERDHKLSMCYALGEGVCPIALATGDLTTAEWSVPLLKDLATQHGFTLLVHLGQCLDGQLLIRQGKTADGIALLSSALGEFTLTGHSPHYHFGFVAELARALALVGKIDKARALIAETLARSERDGAGWHLPELRRVECLLTSAG